MDSGNSVLIPSLLVSGHCSGLGTLPLPAHVLEQWSSSFCQMTNEQVVHIAQAPAGSHAPALQ